MLKKGIYENIINQEIERDIHTAESQQMVCIREQMDDAETLKFWLTIWQKRFDRNWKTQKTCTTE